jgi:hypothetical protein
LGAQRGKHARATSGNRLSLHPSDAEQLLDTMTADRSDDP